LEAVIVVVDGGGRHLMGVDGDLGGVGQLAAGQPAHPNAARVGPPGEAPGPLPTQRLAKVIKGWWTEVLGVGQDLLPSIQIRPGAGDQLRDLLQLACVPLLDGLLGVGGWSFEVLQVPGHEREHARSPTPAAGWWLPKPCIQPSQSDLLGPVNAYGRIVDVTPIQASSWQPAPAPASLPQQMAHSLPQRRSLTGSDLTVGPAAVDAKPTHSLPLAQGAAAPGHPSAPPPSRSATAAAFLGATPPTPSPVTTRGGGRPACQPCRITCRHRDPASARFHHGGTPPFGSGQDRQVQRMN
jgi:hypothetical protein